MNIRPADQITGFRGVLVVVLVALSSRPATTSVAWIIVVIAIVAVVLDGVDGWVARRTGTASAFGMRFDTETDAALILVLALLTWRHGKLRYLFVAAGWVWPWMAGPLAPTLRGRVICVVQIAALIVALAPIIVPPASTAIAAAGLGALVYSFLIDTRRLAGQRRTQ